MALFAIQLVRVVLAFIPVPVEQDHVIQVGNDFVIVINQMLNVNIIRSSFVLADNIFLTRESHQQ